MRSLCTSEFTKEAVGWCSRGARRCERAFQGHNIRKWLLTTHKHACPFRPRLRPPPLPLLSLFSPPQFLDPLIDFFSQWCESMDKGCDRGSTSSLKPVSSVFEALKTLLQLYGTACAPMLRADGRGVLDFVLRRFTKAQVRRAVRARLVLAGAGGWSSVWSACGPTRREPACLPACLLAVAAAARARLPPPPTPCVHSSPRGASGQRQQAVRLPAGVEKKNF